MFKDAAIIHSTGANLFRGHVYIEGEIIQYVGKDSSVQIICGHGCTLLSGLGDAHTHLTWTNTDITNLGDLPLGEHTLATATAAASTKQCLDIVIRDAITEGSIPGLRYLANKIEICVPGGDLVPGISAYASGVQEMRMAVEEVGAIRG